MDDPQPDAEKAEPLPVRVLSVRMQDEFRYEGIYAGLVRSQRASPLGFQLGGRVDEVLVEEGDLVKAGQRLALLDTRKLKAGRRQARAALARARAQSGISELTARRLAELAKKDFTPAQQADEARFGRDAALAGVEELVATLAQIEVDLEHSVLRAPFAGRVTDRIVDEGTVVGAGAPVVRLQGAAGKEAFIGVPPSEAEALELGAALEVSVGAQRWTGRLVGVVDEVDPRTRTVGLVVALPEDADPTTGAVARLRLTRSLAERGAWLPLAALSAGDRGGWAVLSLDSDLRLKREAVEVIHQNERQAYVRGTLSHGDRVVAAGLHRVVPGQLVQVSGEEPAP
ncbi:MAG: efflux RND transporter periplasmic adaptor subunit [Myxococcota bacterium]